jgi:glutaredoxin
MPEKSLILYARTYPCPDVERARKLLRENAISYREVMIDENDAAQAYIESLVGYRSVPTLVVTQPGGSEPIEAPRALEKGRSPRGVDRGTVITEPDLISLRNWLRKHGFVGG